jgi:hypothetical protein
VSSLELENALQLFVKNWVRENGAVDDKKHPFELYEYRMLEFGQSPNGASLAKLAPLLLQLLAVAANAVVNQKSLEVALRELAAHERNMQLLSPTLTEAHWSSWLAGQLRTALSHCRKLKLRPKLMQQTLRKTPGCYHQALKELVGAVDVEGELMDGVSDGNLEALALADELVHAASSAEAAPKTPPCKKGCVGKLRMMLRMLHSRCTMAVLPLRSLVRRLDVGDCGERRAKRAWTSTCCCRRLWHGGQAALGQAALVQAAL